MCEELYDMHGRETWPVGSETVWMSRLIGGFTSKKEGNAELLELLGLEPVKKVD